MALGPREKSELELHWQHQLDYVRAETRNVYRRLSNAAETEAFRIISDHYQRTGELLDLRAAPAQLRLIAAKALEAGNE